jgi:hypothetical protein
MRKLVMRHEGKTCSHRGSLGVSTFSSTALILILGEDQCSAGLLYVQEQKTLCDVFYYCSSYYSTSYSCLLFDSIIAQVGSNEQARRSMALLAAL